MSKRKRYDSLSLSPQPESVSPRKKSKKGAKTDQGKVAAAPRRRHAYTLAPQIGTHVLFLFVGEGHELLTIHSDLLPNTTRAYLNTKFYQQQVCWLRNQNPAIAHLWRLFLYTGYVFSDDQATDQDTPDDGDEETHADGEWTKLAHAYIFGRKVRDEAFANACVTALIEKVKQTERFPTGIASEVYAYTGTRSKLRKLIVDLHVWMGQGLCLDAPHEDAEAPDRFWDDFEDEMDVAEAVEFEGKWLWETDPCKYHRHTVTRVCGT